MRIAIRKAGDSVEIFKCFEERFSASEIEAEPYNYAVREIPDEFADSFTGADFDENLNFDADRHKLNVLNEKREDLRRLRAAECFSIINRGELWYDMLGADRYCELEQWYRAWLDVTDTLAVPVKPRWLDK